MVTHVFLGLGSNYGNRLYYIEKALQDIASSSATHVQQVSSIYETEPYGYKYQPDFLNVVIECCTRLSPVQLLLAIKWLEKKTGRINRGFWKPREIDIDILTYDDIIIQLPWLKIPHHELHERKFVLKPFVEINPDFLVPKYNQIVECLFNACTDPGKVEVYIHRKDIESKIITSQEEIPV